MAIASDEVIGKAQAVLQDTTGTRWGSLELLGWLNDGQREICMLKPAISATNKRTTLVSGTKQEIPDEGMQVLRIIRNLSSTGAGGKAVRVISRDVLDTSQPMWHSSKPQAIADHYIFDDLDPRTFYVYPPNDGSGYVEVVYAVEPTKIEQGDDISIPAIHSNNLLDYILYRAYAKESDDAGNAQRSNQHYQAMVSSLGVKVQVDAVTSPNMRTVRQG